MNTRWAVICPTKQRMDNAIEVFVKEGISVDTTKPWVSLDTDTEFKLFCLSKESDIYSTGFVSYAFTGAYCLARVPYRVRFLVRSRLKRYPSARELVPDLFDKPSDYSPDPSLWPDEHSYLSHLLDPLL